MLQRLVVCCSVSQCVNAGDEFKVLQDCKGVLCVALCCSALQCVAVCCSVMQCVAVCRSVLQLLLRAAVAAACEVGDRKSVV